MQITELYEYILSLSQGNEITCLCTFKSDVEGLCEVLRLERKLRKKFHFLHKLLALYIHGRIILGFPSPPKWWKNNFSTEYRACFSATPRLKCVFHHGKEADHFILLRFHVTSLLLLPFLPLDNSSKHQREKGHLT